MRVAIDIYK